MMNSLPRGQKAVAVWMYTGVAMLLVQVILGGITRLTGSGLSITEWNVVTGALPPLSDQQWLNEFSKYRQTPQYQLLNADFNIHNFKFIFFWEWLHRFWARLIGVVFIVGFIYLLARKYLKPTMIKPLLVLFLLGAVQGAIGWIMVLSGLTDDMVYVKPVKLALHFVFALVLVCYAWWFALQLSIAKRQHVVNNTLRNYTVLILVTLFFQLIYGALMAGHKAAAAAPTWPTINGSWWPADLLSPAINFVESKITVHFIHRGLAYLLLLFTIIWTLKAKMMVSASGLLRRTIWLPFIFIVIQAVLGIFTVLSSPSIVANHWGLFEWLAQFHQVTAMGYLLAVVLMLFIFHHQRSAA
ncbi:MAG: COX15/CtaA family protein [Chitinophagaceae bacterium]